MSFHFFHIGFSVCLGQLILEYVKENQTTKGEDGCFCTFSFYEDKGEKGFMKLDDNWVQEFQVEFYCKCIPV